jgi:hypothetical protein
MNSEMRLLGDMSCQETLTTASLEFLLESSFAVVAYDLLSVAAFRSANVGATFLEANGLDEEQRLWRERTRPVRKQEASMADEKQAWNGETGLK